MIYRLVEPGMVHVFCLLGAYLHNTLTTNTTRSPYILARQIESIMAIKESNAKVIVFSIILPTFATSIYLLRLRARLIRKHPFKSDDYHILVSLVRDSNPR